MTQDEFAGFDLDDVVRKAEAEKAKAAKAPKPASAPENTRPVVPFDADFALGDYNDYWRINWVRRSQDNAMSNSCQLALLKLPLGNWAEKSFAEWREYTDATAGRDFHVPNAPQLHEIICVLNRHRDHPHFKHQVEVIRGTLQRYFLATYFMTLSKIEYHPPGLPDQIIHYVPNNCKIYSANNIDQCNDSKILFEKLLGESDHIRGTYAYNWLTGGNRMDIVTLRDPEKYTPVLFSTHNDDKCFLIMAGANTHDQKYPALGIRPELGPVYIGLDTHDPADGTNPRLDGVI